MIPLSQAAGLHLDVWCRPNHTLPRQASISCLTRHAMREGRCLEFSFLHSASGLSGSGGGTVGWFGLDLTLDGLERQLSA